VFKGCRIRGGAVSEYLFAHGLCLPSGTQMTEGDLERIVNVIKRCCTTSKRK
jgi:dTDP-4-amino-4,6-dideoxygalactose transaminase